MKRLLVIILTLCILTGCQNPIASSISKEGEKTRAELQSELELAKYEIGAENRAMIEQLMQKFNNDYNTIVGYLSYIASLQQQNATYPGFQR